MTKENNGWISVEDRLPDDPKKEVLAWLDYYQLARYSGGEWWYYYSDEYVENTGWAILHGVTHWQPLPPPITND